MRQKAPTIAKVPERSFSIFNIYFKIFRIEINVRSESFSEHLEADNQIGRQRLLILFADTGRHAPWQEFRIALHVGDKRIKLFRAVRDHPLFSMDCHIRPLPSQLLASAALRASWRAAKSASA